MAVDPKIPSIKKSPIVISDSPTVLRFATSELPFVEISELRVLGVDTSALSINVVAGIVTITWATIKADADYTIVRETEISQTTRFGDQSGFTPEIRGEAYDKLTRIAQDQQEQIDRSVKLETKQDGFTPVIKGEVPAGAIITRGVDKTDADGEDERGHLTAGITA